MIPNVRLTDLKDRAFKNIHYLDKFYATYNQLVGLLGEPNNKPSGDGKASVEWSFTYKDNIPGTIYDWKESESPRKNPDEKYEWHIGGSNNNDLWTYDITDYIEKHIKEVVVNDNNRNVRTLTKMSEVKEWLARNPKVLHLLENNYYRDLLTEDKESIIKTIVDNKAWLEENIEDDIDIDIDALINEPESQDAVIFDNFTLETYGELKVDSINKDDLDVTFSLHLQSYRVECSMNEEDTIGDCDVFKEHEGTVTYGNSVKFKVSKAVFQIPKESPLFLTDNELNTEALTDLMTWVVENASCTMTLGDTNFDGVLEVTTDIAFDEDRLNDVRVSLVVLNPEVVDEVDSGDGYQDKYIEFIVVSEDGDQLYTDEVLSRAITFAKENNAWKIEKVVYGQLDDGTWDVVLTDDVWCPNDGTIIPEDRIYQ